MMRKEENGKKYRRKKKLKKKDVQGSTGKKWEFWCDEKMSVHFDKIGIMSKRRE